MFEEYFKLKEQPFGASPDPSFLFWTSSHSEALASLCCGFFGNRCFTVLIAEPGMGKTTLLFEFLERIRDQARTAFLFNTICDPNDILSFILYDLGVTPAPSKVERHRQLNDILTTEARIGRRVVVVIDEAQNLSGRTLEAVRLLTNFETSHSKLLHVVLAGQPELADKLAAAEAAQLFQRVSTLCRLTPFGPADVSAYIAHRLKVAGYTGSTLFTAGAIHLLAVESRGIPRRINTLCFNSLCLCKASKAKQVDRAMMAEAISDLQLHAGQQTATSLQMKGAAVSPTGFLSGPKRLSSMSTPVKYLAAGALAACVALAGFFARHTRVLPLFRSSPLAVVSASSSSVAAGGKPVPAAADRRPAKSDTPGRVSTHARATLPNEATQQVRITIAAGETLEGIATTHLGIYDGPVLRRIQTLNPRITDPDHIETGTTIRLPGRGGSESPIASTRLQP